MQVVALIDEDNGRFGVSFPDFPGCTTVARSLDHAVAKAGEVLAFHVEGLAEDGTLPEPRTLGELRGDPQFRESVANALAFLVPYAPPSRAMRINITMDEALLVRIDAAANAAGESRSGYLAEAAKRRLASEFVGAAHERYTDAMTASNIPASRTDPKSLKGRAASMSAARLATENGTIRRTGEVTLDVGRPPNQTNKRTSEKIR